MIRRTALAAAVGLLLLATAAAAEPGQDKLSNLQQKVTEATLQEGVLTSRIAAMNRRIHSLASSVAAAESKLARLQVEVGVHQQRLVKVKTAYEQESRMVRMAQRQYTIARRHLANRLVALYESDQPDTVAVVLGSENISDAMNRLEYLNDLSVRDQDLAAQAMKVRDRWTTIRTRTHRLLVRVEAETRAVEISASRVIDTRDRLTGTRDQLQAQQARQKKTLASVQESKEKWLADIAALQASSADIAARLRSSGSHSTATPSSAGLIWPVQGVITSPFGMRWGRMHEGIDIGAPTGTPIWAAAGGTVFYAGWEGGYGNLTVIDHGNGLATAYGHQSRIVVATGQTVTRGQVIGYVGSTGHSTGPHLHFEVRVNGTPVDPLGYLP
jgi:murein DD-endopeptidase MepM/ murein hydrolase activator NlpD